MGSSLPDRTYEFILETSMDAAPFISDFECLVQGENLVGRPACDYYKAMISGPQTPDPITQICFKEIAGVNVPREYEAENTYRIIIETEPRENNRGFEGITLARIVSDNRVNQMRSNPETKSWRQTTTVGFYDCEAPYDGKSYN